jgi:predicted secreted protein
VRIVTCTYSTSARRRELYRACRRTATTAIKVEATPAGSKRQQQFALDAAAIAHFAKLPQPRRTIALPSPVRATTTTTTAICIFCGHSSSAPGSVHNSRLVIFAVLAHNVIAVIFDVVTIRHALAFLSSLHTASGGASTPRTAAHIPHRAWVRSAPTAYGSSAPAGGLGGSTADDINQGQPLSRCVIVIYSVHHG